MSIEIPIDLIMGEDSATPAIITSLKTMQDRFKSLSSTIAIAARQYEKMGSTGSEKMVKEVARAGNQFKKTSGAITDQIKVLKTQQDTYIKLADATQKASDKMSGYENKVIAAAGGIMNLTQRQINAIFKMNQKYAELGGALTDLKSDYVDYATQLGVVIGQKEDDIVRTRAQAEVYKNMRASLKKMNEETKQRQLRSASAVGVMGMTKKGLSSSATQIQQLEFFQKQAQAAALVSKKLDEQYNFELKILQALNQNGERKEDIEKLETQHLAKLESALHTLKAINRVGDRIEANITAEERLTHIWNNAVKKLSNAFKAIDRKINNIVNGMKKAGRSARNFGRNLQFTARDIMFTVGALGAFAVLGVKSFAELEKEAAQLGISMGYVGDAIEQGMAAIKTGFATTKAFGASMEQTAQMMTLIEQAGFKGAQGLMVLEQSMKLAKATFSDADVAVDALTDVLISFRKSLPEDLILATTHAMDVLTLASIRSKATLSEIRTSMQYVSGIAEAYSFSLESVAAAMATLTNAGIPASVGSRRLGSVLDSLVTKGGDYIGNIRDQSGELKSMVDLLKMVETRYESFSSEIDRAGFLSEMFGARQAELVKRLLDSGDSLEALVEEMENANGVTAQYADETGERLDLQLKELINTIDAMKIAMGESIGTQLKESEILITLIDTLERLEPFFRELGRGIGKGLVAFLTVVNNVLSSIADSAEAVTDGFEQIGGVGTAASRAIIDLLDRVGIRIGFLNNFLTTLGDALDKLFGKTGGTTLESIASALTQVALFAIMLVPVLAGLGLIIEAAGVAMSLFAPVITTAVGALKLLSAGAGLVVSGAQTGLGIATASLGIMAGLTGAIATALGPGITAAIQAGWVYISGQIALMMSGAGTGAAGAGAGGAMGVGGVGAFTGIAGLLSGLARAIGKLLKLSVILTVVIGAIVGIFEGLMAAIGVFARMLEGPSGLSGLFQGLMDILSPIIDILGGLFHVLFQFGRLIGVIIGLGFGVIIAGAVKIVTAITDFITSFEIVNDFLKGVSDELQKLIDWFNGVGNAMQEFTDSLLDAPEEMFAALATAIEEIFQQLADDIKAIFPIGEFGKQGLYEDVTGTSGKPFVLGGKGSIEERTVSSIQDFGNWLRENTGFGNVFGLNFASGGRVPGPIGVPRPAIVHGGEEIRTPSQQASDGAATEIHIHNTFNINGVDPMAGRRIMKEIETQMRVISATPGV